MRARLLVLLTVLAIAGCGGQDDRQSSRTTATEAGSSASVDRAFARLMIPHHEGAVEMAELALERGEDDFVKGLAQDIVTSQKGEIAALRDKDAELAGDGVEVGDLGVPEQARGMHHDIDQLRAAGDFDRVFVEMMIPHHEGAIAMARAELDRGQDAELKQLARSIVSAQVREISLMKEFLAGAAGGGTGGGGGGGSAAGGSNQAHATPSAE